MQASTTVCDATDQLIAQIQEFPPLDGITILINALICCVISVEWPKNDMPEVALEEIIKDMRQIMQLNLAKKDMVQ